MQNNSLGLRSLLDPDKDFSLEDILDKIIPKRDGYSYELDEIETIIRQLQDQIEVIQRECNDQFESILNEEASDMLDCLCRNLNKAQFNMMQLQCDIAFTKEQLNAVEEITSNPIINDRRELLVKEIQLKGSLQQIKFDPAKKFIERFINHLGETVSVCQKYCPVQASNYKQYFDWTQNHQAILLLKACGKTKINLSRIERLFQSNLDIQSMSFVHPIEQTDLNNFIEFEDTYSLERQLEIITSNNGCESRQDFGTFLSRPDVQSLLNSGDSLEFILLKDSQLSINKVTIECCQLLVDLNMSYIEAYLTDGINIDKLNGNNTVVGGGASGQEVQAMPHYAFAPQEYMTQIGQHLLTLRKKVEQYEGPCSEPLKLALGSLKDATNIAVDVGHYKTVTEMVMRCISRLCLRSVLGRTSNSILSKLTVNGRRQLSTDAMYLDNVLDDLGLLDSNEPNVEKFKNLLIAP